MLWSAEQRFAEMSALESPKPMNVTFYGKRNLAAVAYFRSWRWEVILDYRSTLSRITGSF